MKIKKVEPNNHKKCFEITTAKAIFVFPYSKLRIRPTILDPIESVVIDTDVGGEAYTYKLVSGKADTLHIDQILEYNQEPNYQRTTS